MIDLTKFIPLIKYSKQAYLQMLAKLFPRGAAWNFPILPHVPAWVYLDTYLEDDFEDLLIDSNWHESFFSSHHVKIWNNLNTAVRKADNGVFKNLTDKLLGDLNFEWGIILNNNVNWNLIRINTDNGRLFDFGWTAANNGITIINSLGDVVETIPFTFSQFKVLKFRIIRNNTVFSLQYNYKGSWKTCEESFNLEEQSLYYLQTSSTIDDTGFLYFRCQAFSGLFNKSYISDSTFGVLLSCFADELYRLEETVVKLIRESIPGLSKELLYSWERVAGLPDESTPINATIEQRQIAVHSKITQAKGTWIEGVEFLPLTPAYYIKYAESLGIAITIDKAEGGRPFRTTTKSPGELQRVTRTPADNIDGARLNGLSFMHIWIVTIISDPQGNRPTLEVIFNKIKPAHTIVIFKP